MIYVDKWTHKYLRSIRKGGESIGAATKRITEFYDKYSVRVEKLEQDNKRMREQIDNEFGR